MTLSSEISKRMSVFFVGGFILGVLLSVIRDFPLFDVWLGNKIVSIVTFVVVVLVVSNSIGKTSDKVDMLERELSKARQQARPREVKDVRADKASSRTPRTLRGARARRKQKRS